MSLRRTGSRLILGAGLLTWASLGVFMAPEAQSGPQATQSPPQSQTQTQPTGPPESCPVHAHQISWPADNPVWTFCWNQPRDTTKDADGSGIRLSHVYYKGKKVFEQASIPCLNVKYMADGACDNTMCCGINLPNNIHTFTYRDWTCQYAPFQANNVLIKPIVRVNDPDSVHTIQPGYAEPTQPVVTLCDVHPNPGKDSGDFYGVAVEKRADRLILTTALESGWYRYTQKWIFYRDGTIQPRIAFTAVNNACTSRAHHHNGYWRFDFDIGDPENDVIEEVNDAGVQPLATETSRANDPAHHRKWRVRDKATGMGYEVVPGKEDGVADDWGVADMWALRYKGAREHDDGGLRTNQVDGARIHVNDYLNDEAIDGQDLVMWYHTGHMHVGGTAANCDPEMIGPTLKPVGNW
ncbi:MAG TPA: hypothetical protein VGZ22_30580 [Isosphaeraceae bacterium]|jgi:hypothetical protein|nr:hypothetical protein [Isosphaeraceae bacterium]